jgi:ATP-binding cassette subfamily B protein
MDTTQTAQTQLQRDRAVTRALHKLFWKAMAHHRLSFSTVLLFQLPAFFIINIFVPLQIAYGIQDIVHREFDKIGHQAIIVIVSSLIGAAFFAVGQFIYHINEVAGGVFIQRAIFANFLDKDYDFYSSQYIGSLGSDAAELRKSFQEYALIALFTGPRMLVIIFLGLGVIFYKSPLLGLVTTLCVLVIVAITSLGGILRLKYRRLLSKANSDLAGMITDPLSHGATVKSFAQEEYEQQRLKQPLDIWKRAQLRIYNSSIPTTFVRHILLAATSGVLLVVSASLYRSNKISVAVVALAQLYAIRIVTTVVDVGETIKKYEAIMSSAYQPMATMLVPRDIEDPTNTKRLAKSTSHGISFGGVSYAYPEAAKGKYAVSDFSLSVKNGEKVGLVGYSGGGKTTITKLLLRFMDVNTGQIKLDGIDLRELRQSDLRQLISYVPQEPLLFHRSIKDNIAYARPDASYNQIKQTAQTAYVDEFVKDMPAGYDSMVGERGVKLSGGQRQRVAIARALLKDAPMLVLDEATSALDSLSEQYIQKALWELMEDRTAIVIAHRLSTIQRLDRIVVMDKGKIVQIGTHRELLKDKNSIYARLWAHQSGGYIG